MGAGAGVRIGDSYTSIPLYGDVRYTILKKKVSPFIDVKVGYNLLDAAGFYMNPGAGVNWNFLRGYLCFSKLAIPTTPRLMIVGKSQVSLLKVRIFTLMEYLFLLVLASKKLIDKRNGVYAI